MVGVTTLSMCGVIDVKKTHHDPDRYWQQHHFQKTSDERQLSIAFEKLKNSIKT
jgi:hypothetical protein